MRQVPSIEVDREVEEVIAECGTFVIESEITTEYELELLNGGSSIRG